MKNKLVVLGSAPCLEEDFKSLKIFEPFEIMAIGVDALNRIDKKISYVASYHEEDFQRIREEMGSSEYKLIYHKEKEGVVAVKDLFGQDHYKTSGSSALLGVCYALQNGCNKIILAGCPLEGENSDGISYLKFRQGWITHKQHVLGKVKSVSGWTAAFLGVPTMEWWEENNGK